MKTDAERLNDLEIKYTHQADTVRDLHEVIWSQERRITQLEAQIVKLMQHLREQGTDGQAGEALPHEKPPHYLSAIPLQRRSEALDRAAPRRDRETYRP